MFKIGKVKFNKKKTVLIAEAGVNHNGNIKFAKKLIDEAKKSNCDIIKFQTYKADKLTTKSAPRFWNWSGEIKKKGTQFDSYSNLDSFNKNHYKILINYFKKKNIEFLSTPFDKESVDMLVSIGMKGFKIASCDITNFELIKCIAKTKLPILLSTGASNINEIKDAVKVIKKCGVKMKEIWETNAQKHNIKVEISGIDSLCALAFKSEKNQLMNTLYTSEMLKRGYLAFRQFKPSLSHINSDYELFNKNVSEVFSILSQENIEDLLKTPLHHTGFSRLTKE